MQPFLHVARVRSLMDTILMASVFMKDIRRRLNKRRKSLVVENECHTVYMCRTCRCDITFDHPHCHRYQNQCCLCHHDHRRNRSHLNHCHQRRRNRNCHRRRYCRGSCHFQRHCHGSCHCQCCRNWNCHRIQDDLKHIHRHRQQSRTHRRICTSVAATNGAARWLL